MELWRHCAVWLIECRVLPESHRVTWDSAQVCELAQALRDGVLLCQLLNNLLPHAINLREINLRPQMSQFLCLKNIRTFLGVCQEKFHLRKTELFEAFDLFDVRDFGKVIDTLSILSHSPISTQKGFQSFPIDGCIADDDIYSGLSDQIDETVDEDDDLYDCVEDEENEGDEIYEDLMRADEPSETQQQQKMEVDKRECCLQEIRQTEEKYTDTLESILQHFMKPLQKFLQPHDIESIFINTADLAVTHRSLLGEIQTSILTLNAENLYQVFINYKERLLPYGRYCSQVEAATKHLDKMSAMKEGVRMKLEECSKRANSGRFSLRDLLMVPMQRVLKYHLLLQELVKHTSSTTEKENLRTALDAMRDLAQCVNEVKRDNEIIKQITTFQLSIENMTQSLALFGRPKIDGELKISSSEKKSKQDRYAFLFDKAMLVCKKKSGETMELKEIIDLQNYQLRDETTGEKDSKKWSHFFLLIDCYGKSGYDLFFKTRDLKKKWLEQFEMALSNMCPENCTANNHDFQMHCFEDTTSCKACCMLLRGIFFQGYRCSRCRMAAHKECLGRVPGCGRNSEHSATVKKNQNKKSASHRPASTGFPKMEVCQEYYGLPPPPVAFGQPLHLSMGDVIELTRADAELTWWEGKNVMIGQMGWFPCSKVQPFISRSTPDLSDFLWFAGNMDRSAAKNLLISRSDGTFLVRQKDGGEFAISLKFNMDIRHIKITSTEGLYRINEKKAFKGLIEMVQFYQQHSLKEYFKDVDTTLQTPFNQPEQSDTPFNTPSPGTQTHTTLQTPFNQPEQSDTLFNTPSPGGSMRSFSTARARYDFSARDRTELSLREGDTVKVLSKKAHNGWWKGEVYGRVGLFPANYVEEDYSEYC
ncbi:proto-oncogene vav-like isoform X1 [Salvelinus fontinalis]|uniref:proto-oncogene vav-like isoform X1 n=1 Tax=Salvelinus fontinalis TaxID=8038 RepID=UPI002485E931|nr:proto-oncogene vav-like isoform X1 [Salvelinus fontinalis]